MAEEAASNSESSNIKPTGVAPQLSDDQSDPPIPTRHSLGGLNHPEILDALDRQTARLSAIQFSRRPQSLSDLYQTNLAAESGDDDDLARRLDALRRQYGGDSQSLPRKHHLVHSNNDSDSFEEGSESRRHSRQFHTSNQHHNSRAPPQLAQHRRFSNGESYSESGSEDFDSEDEYASYEDPGPYRYREHGSLPLHRGAYHPPMPSPYGFPSPVGFMPSRPPPIMPQVMPPPPLSPLGPPLHAGHPMSPLRSPTGPFHSGSDYFPLSGPPVSMRGHARPPRSRAYSLDGPYRDAMAPPLPPPSLMDPEGLPMPFHPAAFGPPRMIHPRMYRDVDESFSEEEDDNLEEDYDYPPIRGRGRRQSIGRTLPPRRQSMMVPDDRDSYSPNPRSILKKKSLDDGTDRASSPSIVGPGGEAEELMFIPEPGMGMHPHMALSGMPGKGQSMRGGMPGMMARPPGNGMHPMGPGPGFDLPMMAKMPGMPGAFPRVTEVRPGHEDQDEPAMTAPPGFSHEDFQKAMRENDSGFSSMHSSMGSGGPPPGMMPMGPPMMAPDGSGGHVHPGQGWPPLTGGSMPGGEDGPSRFRGPGGMDRGGPEEDTMPPEEPEENQVQPKVLFGSQATSTTQAPPRWPPPERRQSLLSAIKQSFQPPPRSYSTSDMEYRPGLGGYTEDTDDLGDQDVVAVKCAHMDPTKKSPMPRKTADSNTNALAEMGQIWCFRRYEPGNNSGIWTAFDYRNQNILTDHYERYINVKEKEKEKEEGDEGQKEITDDYAVLLIKDSHLVKPNTNPPQYRKIMALPQKNYAFYKEKSALGKDTNVVLEVARLANDHTATLLVQRQAMGMREPVHRQSTGPKRGGIRRLSSLFA